MPESSHDLGVADTIVAEAVGLPGERTFRLVFDNRSAHAALWLEKEQLRQLALSLQQLVDDNSSRVSKASEDDVDDTSQVTEKFELQIAKIEISYEGKKDLFLIVADSTESALVLSFCIRHDQAVNLSEQSIRIYSSGRPLCPLCELPISSEPHRCVKRNGHSPLSA